MSQFIFEMGSNDSEFEAELRNIQLSAEKLDVTKRGEYSALKLFEFLSTVTFKDLEDARYGLRYILGKVFSCTLKNDSEGYPRGSHAVVLKCSNVYVKNFKDSHGNDVEYSCNCNFKVSFAPSGEEGLKLFTKRINVDSLKHYLTLENDYTSPCVSSFNATFSDFMKSKDKDLLKRTVDQYGNKQRIRLEDIIDISLAARGIKISRDNAKKASALINKAFLEAELEHMSDLEPLLEIMQELYELKYRLEKDPITNNLIRLIVILPYTLEYSNSECNTKLYGIDTAHIRDLPMKNDSNAGVEESKQVVFIGHKLAVISTRSPSNNLMILGFAVVYSESADDIGALLKFMVDSNIKLNDPSITVISDRSAAIKRAIDDNVGLAYHAYCPLHIERNLKARHWAAHLNLYHAARRAENEHIFLVRMAKIEVV
jgi:hypothetical protein